MKPLLRMAARNTLKNWRHSLASMLSIAVGVVALGLFEGYMADLRSLYDDGFSKRGMLGDVLIEKAGAEEGAKAEPWKFLLGDTEQSFLERYLKEDGGVVARVRFLNLSGLASNGRTSAVIVGFGYDAAEGAITRGPRWAWNTLAGKPLQEAGPDSVLLGRSIGQIFGCIPSEPGPHAGKDPREVPLSCRSRLQLSSTTGEGRLNAVDVEVAGLATVSLKELEARYAIMPLPLAQQLLDTKGVSMYTVRLEDPAQAGPFSERLQTAARQAGIELQAKSWREHRLGEVFRRGMGVLGVFRAFVALVVVIVAGMSVLNTLYKAVSERTREIGTLRSLGFLRRHIVALFGLEGGLLALVASVGGVLITVVLAALVNRAGITYKGGLLAEAIPLTIAVTPGLYMRSVVMLCVLAVIAAVIPARRAARMKIPDALGAAN
jgi:putative ABC transport system permease protein